MIVQLPISKSIANRQLIMGRDVVKGIPVSDLPSDVRVLSDALSRDVSSVSTCEVNINDCGTAMRFLAAYYAATPSNVLLTGTERMCQRPIAPLVDALRQLGADIQYVGQEGFPPLLIKGKYLSGGVVHIRGDVSSQFVSALMLISQLTDSGITINLLSPQVSSPYVAMTQAVIDNPDYPLEADWSSAAFWYEYVALGGTKTIHLLDLDPYSVQGDKVVEKLFEQLGVQTEVVESGVVLHATGRVTSRLYWDFTDCPDLYPAVKATCVGLNVPTHFTGLNNLRFKESDRLMAMDSILDNDDFESADHRVVMARAMLKVKYSDLQVLHTDCVEKSYPHFWEQYKLIF